jgi:hypothetical protein
MNITQVPIKDLKFADYNPRKITEKQVEELKKSVDNFGMVEPIVVNNNPESMNTIIGGHQRVLILEMLGQKDVPVVYIDLSLEKEKELNIRLNKSGGEWDFDKLANEFDMGNLLSFGFNEGELVGFEDKEAEPKYVYDCPHCTKKIKLSNRVKKIEMV